MKSLIFAIVVLAVCAYGAHANFTAGETKIAAAETRAKRAGEEKAALDRDIAARNDKIGKARAQLDALKATLAETARTAPEAALIEARKPLQKQLDERAAELEVELAKVAAAAMPPEEFTAALKEAEQQMAELQAKMKKLTAELPTLLKYKAAEEAAIKSTTGKTRINRL